MAAGSGALPPELGDGVEPPVDEVLEAAAATSLQIWVVMLSVWLISDPEQAFETSGVASAWILFLLDAWHWQA